MFFSISYDKKNISDPRRNQLPHLAFDKHFAANPQQSLRRLIRDRRKAAAISGGHQYGTFHTIAFERRRSAFLPARAVCFALFGKL